ncbi:MAG: hypothetical protein KDC98_05555 [Planctomycetes bacterium]|nr:hypothetical protein [Planctomycetota bacterium]
MALAVTAPAQLGRDQAAELSRLQRIKERKGSEIEQLVDRRLRHDLGLPSEPDPTMRRVDPLTTGDKERMIRELRDAEGETATYLGRYNKMKNDIEALRAEIEARNATRDEQDSFIVVPSVGSAQRSETVQSPSEAIDTGPRPQGEAQIRTPETPTVSEDVAVQLDRVRGRIQGSEDHLRVAQALFKAGQALMDRAETAREHADAAAARDYDERGKERLGRALAELAPLLDEQQPAYAALFCKGRCLELLFRFSVRYEGLSLQRSAKVFQQREQEVREPFLAISARDVGRTGSHGEVEVLGTWGRSAQVAVEHFRWMNLHAGYRPSTPIESLTWPGEKDK